MSSVVSLLDFASPILKVQFSWSRYPLALCHSLSFILTFSFEFLKFHPLLPLKFSNVHPPTLNLLHHISSLSFSVVLQFSDALPHPFLFPTATGGGGIRRCTWKKCLHKAQTFQAIFDPQFDTWEGGLSCTFREENHFPQVN